MVDLARIRKKAKKAKAGSPDSPAPEVERTDSAAEPVAHDTKPEPPETAPEPQEPVRPAVPPSTGPGSSKLEKFKQAAGRRREAEAVQETAEGETGTRGDRVELLTFQIAGEQYAVDIERIVEIVTPRSLTRIPNADASVMGIISLRGTIVTLVDVRRKLRHPPAGPATPDTRIVVLDFQNETVGFLVDRVLRVVKATESQIEPHPVVHATELDDAIRGVFRVNDALTILLDLDKLLDHRSLAVARARGIGGNS